MGDSISGKKGCMKGSKRLVIADVVSLSSYQDHGISNRNARLRSGDHGNSL
jgi:hypothetical protein